MSVSVGSIGFLPFQISVYLGRADRVYCGDTTMSVSDGRSPVTPVTVIAVRQAKLEMEKR